MNNLNNLNTIQLISEEGQKFQYSTVLQNKHEISIQAKRIIEEKGWDIYKYKLYSINGSKINIH